MAASDLKKPLGQFSKSGIEFSRIFKYASLGLSGLLGLFLLTWIFIVDNPHGGYPEKLVDLAAPLTESSKIGIAGIRPGIKPGIPDTTLLAKATPPKKEPNTNVTVERQGNTGIIRILDPTDPTLSQAPTHTEQPAYQKFAREINSDAIAGLPKIAIIIDGLGLSQTTTQEALTLLPADITLAFAPYGNSLNRWTTKARSQGHELLIQVPMEPFDYPNNDPGPHTLLTAVDTQENMTNLIWILERFDSYVGAINYMGARFASDEVAGGDFMRELKKRTMLYVENGASGRSRLNAIATSMGVPNLQADLVIDVRGRSADIETRLVQLETIAQDKGYALGIATAFPISIRTIAEWTQSLRQRGFALVPVTAILHQ